MKSVRTFHLKAPTKAPIGIIGFDKFFNRELSRGRVTLLGDGLGFGHPIFMPQFLLHGSRDGKKLGMAGASLASDRQPQ